MSVYMSVHVEAAPDAEETYRQGQGQCLWSASLAHTLAPSMLQQAARARQGNSATMSLYFKVAGYFYVSIRASLFWAMARS